MNVLKILIKTRRRADLPLDQGDVGTRFVMLVILMMTALATTALGGALVVHALRAGWVDAVRGNLTVEIPAADATGTVRSAKTLAASAASIGAAITKIPGVARVHILTRADVENLVRPWLGSQAGQDDLPLPALLGVSLDDSADSATAGAVARAATAVDAAAGVETHQSWVSDLRRFSLVLMLAAAAMAAATIACCILTVAGAVQSRLMAHQADIDLLHVVGATDAYIGAQFVRVVVRLVGSAAAGGTVIGLVLLKIGGLVAGKISSAVLPAHHWGAADLLCFLALPALVTGLCFIAARATVLRSLRVMP